MGGRKNGSGENKKFQLKPKEYVNPNSLHKIIRDMVADQGRNKFTFIALEERMKMRLPGFDRNTFRSAYDALKEQGILTAEDGWITYNG